MNRLRSHLDWMEGVVNNINPVERLGRVVRVTGLVIESEGPDVPLGAVCEIRSFRNEILGMAEVVGFKEHSMLLMPLESIYGLQAGCRVVASTKASGVPVGESLLGRVLDGIGRPIDDKGPIHLSLEYNLYRSAPNPMKRKRISQRLETGIRAIDTFTPLGMGQRMGIFAGSGVGKSTLLGMMAKSATADVNVIALVGERGRELKDFIDQDLGEVGLKKTVLVVSTSDQPAPLRLRAALMATSIAEYFRDQGKNVLFMMDSLTRLAMAQREIGLSIGEPPSSRGYTPSVFSLLPRIVERTGMGDVGSITALYTVLVEGDDMNEPVADTVRGIVDGHLVLSRNLASANHYPAIDVLESLSRLSSQILNENERLCVSKARDYLATYKHSEDLIQVGAYVPNTNHKIDQAIEKQPQIIDFLKQKQNEYTNVETSFEQLNMIVS